MKKLLVLLLLFWSALLTAQREVYVTEFREPITKTEFDKEETESYFYMDYETEDLIVHVKAKRELKGKLDRMTHKLLRDSLYHRIDEPVNRKSVMVIVYSPGMDDCSRTGSRSLKRSKHRKLKEYVDQLENTELFYLYNEPEGNKAYGKNINWIQDKPKIIQELFFPIHFPCGSFVLIDKKGKYCAWRGEYAVEQIIEYLEETELTFLGK